MNNVWKQTNAYIHVCDNVDYKPLKRKRLITIDVVIMHWLYCLLTTFQVLIPNIYIIYNTNFKVGGLLLCILLLCPDFRNLLSNFRDSATESHWFPLPFYYRLPPSSYFPKVLTPNQLFIPRNPCVLHSIMSCLYLNINLHRLTFYWKIHLFASILDFLNECTAELSLRSRSLLTTFRQS